MKQVSIANAAIENATNDSSKLDVPVISIEVSNKKKGYPQFRGIELQEDGTTIFDNALTTAKAPIAPSWSC